MGLTSKTFTYRIVALIAENTHSPDLFSASSLAEDQMSMPETEPSDFSMVGSLSMEEEVQYFFYNMKLVRLLRESKIASAFQIAEKIEKLMKGELPPDCPAKLLLKMRQPVEDYEKTLEDDDGSRGSSSEPSSEESTDDEEEEAEGMADDRSKERNESKVFATAPSALFAEKHSFSSFSKERLLFSGPSSLRQDSVPSVEEDLEAVISHLRQQRARRSVERPLLEEGGRESFRSALKPSDAEGKAGESMHISFFSDTGSGGGGVVSAAEAPSTIVTLKVPPVPPPSSNARKRKHKSNQEVGKNIKTVSLVDRQERASLPIKNTAEKEGNHVDEGKVEVPERNSSSPLRMDLSSRLPLENVEEEIPLCEEDMQILGQIEKEVEQEMKKLSIIRRHR